MRQNAPSEAHATACGAAFGAHEIRGTNGETWSTRQVAHLLGITLPAVRLLVHTGDLRPIAPGEFDAEQVRAYMRTSVMPHQLRSVREARSA